MMWAFLMKPEYFDIESDFLYNLNNHNIENNFLLPIYEWLRYWFNFLEWWNYKENNIDNLQITKNKEDWIDFIKFSNATYSYNFSEDKKKIYKNKTKNSRSLNLLSCYIHLWRELSNIYNDFLLNNSIKEIEFWKIYYNNKNTKMKKEQSYRASVWALIIDKDFNFLMVKLAGEKEEKYDFVKWWMNWWEDYKDTIKRELKEELWKEFKYEIIWKSDWFFFYDWDRELQERKWFRWQMRQNFWIKYISWKIILDKNELSSYKWIKKDDILQELKKSNFPNIEIEKFQKDFEKILKVD